MSIVTSVWALLGLVAPTASLILLTAPTAIERVVPVRGRSTRSIGGHRPTQPSLADAVNPRSTAARRVRRTRPPQDTEVAQWCDRLARRLRTGDSLVAAIRHVPTSPALDEVLHPVRLGLDRGADLHTALRSTAQRTPAVDLAIAVLTASARLGGPAAEPIDRAGAAIRRRVADEAERRTHSAQARASALTLTALPGGVLVLLSASSSTVRHQLTQPVGALSVGLGAALNLAGWRWMRRIIEAPT